MLLIYLSRDLSAFEFITKVFTVWSDKESSEDYLNFGEVSQLAVDILTSPTMLPVSLGIFGNWGAGKSSLLQLIDNNLRQDDQARLVINFDAWIYQGYDDARTALLEVIARELEKAVSDDAGLATKAKSLLSRIDKLRTLGLLAEGAALAFGIPTGGILAKGVGAITGASDGVDSEEEYQNIAKMAQDAKQSAKGILHPVETMTPPQHIDAFRKEYGEVLEALGKPVIVTIDNLDRCLPVNAIHTLEAIRLFLFLPNTAFVIAADEDMIRTSVAEHFKGLSERHQIDYLDKLIQVPIRVPKAGVREIRSYLFMLYAIDSGIEPDKLEILRAGLEDSLQQSWHAEPIEKDAALALTGAALDSDLASLYDLADRISPILASSPIIHGNPRVVKRLLNVVKMRSQIAHRRSIPLDEGVITKLVIFERCAGAEATADLYRLIDAEQGTPKIFEGLEDSKSDTFPGECPESWTRNPTTKSFIDEWSKLAPSLLGTDLRAAIYLSRETMPVSSYVVGISPKGREALKVLISVSKISSPAGQSAAGGMPLEDEVPVMEAILEHLRKVTDWRKQPEGFAGAMLLAQQSSESANIFVRFITGLGNKAPWMNMALKNKDWYKEK